jgi:histone deacetylase 1/2
MFLEQQNEASGLFFTCCLFAGLLKSFERIMYVDMDVHHCDAVEDAFSMTDKVLTISFHHYAPYFFPGTGGGSTMGKSGPQTAAVNLPLHEGCSDTTFQPLFSLVLAEAYEQFRQDQNPWIFAKRVCEPHGSFPF